MIRESSSYCRRVQKISFAKIVNAIYAQKDIKWTGRHFMKKGAVFATPLFELFSIINWRTK
jgi:hypothetical protein